MDAFTKMLQVRDPIIMQMQQVLSCQPEPPVDTAAPLSHAVAARAPGDGIDRISRLPVDILRNVVSRLPTKDGARTTVLSKRWRRVWHSVPLVLVDGHVIRGPEIELARVLPRAAEPRGTAAPPRDHTAALSDALAAHPGPFRGVYLTRIKMDNRQAEVASWLQILAAKGVRELVLVNRTRNKDTDVQLPATLFRCTSLTKLYLGFWCFPETATLQRQAAFPYLKEVGLCSLVVKAQDLSFLLDRCPVLEKLLIIRSRCPVCLRIQSHSLRCVQVCSSSVAEISVEHASLLERLLLWETQCAGGLTKVKIGHAPKLRFLGLLVPGMHQLEIGNTIIKVGAKSNAIVPSVQVLAIQVKLGTRTDARMLPSLLRCFPNVKTLYIQSENDDIKSWGPQSGGPGKVNLKFWEDAGGIECIQRHMTKVVLRDFRGKRSELDFLSFIARRAQVLEKMEIVLAPGTGNSTSDRVDSKLRTHMACAKWASGCCELMVSQTLSRPFQEGIPWCYRRAFDLSNQDPFDVSKCVDGKCMSH